MKPIVLDIDGVVADYITAFWKVAAQLYGAPKYTTMTLPNWDAQGGLTRAEFYNVKNITDNDQNFWATLTPLLTNQELIQLAGLPYPIIFCTSRPSPRDFSMLAVTKDWLQQLCHPYNIEFNLVRTTRKGKFVHAVDAAVYIDDKAGNAVVAKYLNPSTNVFLLDRPYNRFNSNIIGKRVQRCKTMRAILQSM